VTKSDLKTKFKLFKEEEEVDSLLLAEREG
jgi:hypothetical protein